MVKILKRLKSRLETLDKQKEVAEKPLEQEQKKVEKQNKEQKEIVKTTNTTGKQQNTSRKKKKYTKCISEEECKLFAEKIGNSDINKNLGVIAEIIDKKVDDFSGMALFYFIVYNLYNLAKFKGAVDIKINKKEISSLISKKYGQRIQVKKGSMEKLKEELSPKDITDPTIELDFKISENKNRTKYELMLFKTLDCPTVGQLVCIRKEKKKRNNQPEPDEIIQNILDQLKKIKEDIENIQ